MPKPKKESTTIDFDKSAKIVNGRGVLKEGQTLDTYGKKGDTVHTGFPESKYERVEGVQTKKLPETVMVRWEGKTYKASRTFRTQENGARFPVYDWETKTPVYR